MKSRHQIVRWIAFSAIAGASAMSFAGCARQMGNHPKPGSNIAQKQVPNGVTGTGNTNSPAPTVEGLWESECDPATDGSGNYQSVVYNFSGNAYQTWINEFSDSSCQNFTQQGPVQQGSFQLSAASNGVANIDFMPSGGGDLMSLISVLVNDPSSGDTIFYMNAPSSTQRPSQLSQNPVYYSISVSN